MMIETSNDKITAIELRNEAASDRFAVQLARCITPNLLMTFSGDIGTGKTTIIRTLLKTLGVKAAIKSPTFSLVESYSIGGMQIHHFDLYRIQHEDELDYLGFRDYFSNQNVCIIEWAEHAGKVLPKVDIRFNLSIKGAGRSLQMSVGSEAGEKMLTCLAGE